MLIAICSPYRGQVARNVGYAEKALRHSIYLGETPVAPHLLFTRVLDDTNTKARIEGMRLSLELLRKCDLLTCYADYGITEGMGTEMAVADNERIPIEFRSIRNWPNVWEKSKWIGGIKWDQSLWPVSSAHQQILAQVLQ